MRSSINKAIKYAKSLPTSLLRKIELEIITNQKTSNHKVKKKIKNDTKFRKTFITNFTELYKKNIAEKVYGKMDTQNKSDLLKLGKIFRYYIKEFLPHQSKNMNGGANGDNKLSFWKTFGIATTVAIMFPAAGATAMGSIAMAGSATIIIQYFGGDGKGVLKKITNVVKKVVGKERVEEVVHTLVHGPDGNGGDDGGGGGGDDGGDDGGENDDVIINIPQGALDALAKERVARVQGPSLGDENVGGYRRRRRKTRKRRRKTRRKHRRTRKRNKTRRRRKCKKRSRRKL